MLQNYNYSQVPPIAVGRQIENIIPEIVELHLIYYIKQVCEKKFHF